MNDLIKEARELCENAPLALDLSEVTKHADRLNEMVIELADALEKAEAELTAYKAANPPRVRGEWIVLERASNAKFNSVTGVSTINLIYEGTVCSLCGEDGEDEWDYCPNCGADMRKEVDCDQS